MELPSDTTVQRLYHDLAWTWPIISPPEDYVEETERFSKEIRDNSKIEVTRVLHLGCGGGHNDYTFKRHFEVTGVDISEQMLDLAGRLNPEVRYHHGDMRTVRLSQTFDAVVILDSVNYMTAEHDLRSAFATAYEHLRPGGIFLTCIEQIGDQFKQNYTNVSTHSKGDVEITFIENYYDPDPKDTSYEATFVFLIRRQGMLEIFTDHHLCGVFGMETRLKLLREIGFEVQQVKFEHATFAEGEQYPLLLCTRPL